MTTRSVGRHRAAVRPKTPFTELSEAVAATCRTAGRRGAVIAASSGLVLTMGLPVATAAPTAPDPAPPAPAQERQPQPEPQESVTVPADVPITFAGSPITSVTAPPPPPPPPPAPEPRESAERSSDDDRESRSSRASRSTERSSSQGSESSERSSGGSGILGIAARYAGTMYKWGGTTPAGFDCSGFTQYVYRQAGISLPRTSDAQAAGGRRVSKGEAQPGDLVWNGGGHIGIYAGGNTMWDSPRSGKAVQKREMWFTPIFISYR